MMLKVSSQKAFHLYLILIVEQKGWRAVKRKAVLAASVATKCCDNIYTPDGASLHEVSLGLSALRKSFPREMMIYALYARMEDSCSAVTTTHELFTQVVFDSHVFHKKNGIANTARTCSKMQRPPSSMQTQLQLEEWLVLILWNSAAYELLENLKLMLVDVNFAGLTILVQPNLMRLQ